MNKSDLIRELAKDFKMGHKQDARVVVDSVFDAMCDALLEGDRIELRGFGSLRSKKRNARVARNPKSGRKVFVPDRAVVHFKPSNLLLRSINGKRR